jgi:putative flippase GtrA
MNNFLGKNYFLSSDNPHALKIKKICKYCLSGGTGAIIDFGLYSLLIYFFSTNYLVSNLISFSCGTVVTYYLQKNWTFQYKTNNNVAVFQRYILAVIGTYVLNNVLLFTFIDIMIINVFVAKLLQIAISTIWAYSINSLYVFKKNESEDSNIN